MTTGSGTSNLSTTLLDWIVTTLGEAGREIAATQPLTALSLASARGPESAQPNVLRDWAQVLHDAQLSIDQSRLAYVEQARARGLTDADVAVGLGVPAQAVDEEIGRLRTRVNAARQG